MRKKDEANGPSQDGVGYDQVTQKAGRRWSAADAYLHPAAGRANLTIQADALVTGVIIEDGKAAGVRYLHRGAEEGARADSEVIVARGAGNSPQPPIRARAGPADHHVATATSVN